MFDDTDKGRGLDRYQSLSVYSQAKATLITIKETLLNMNLTFD